jgi:hypothetical protein
VLANLSPHGDIANKSTHGLFELRAHIRIRSHEPPLKRAEPECRFLAQRGSPGNRSGERRIRSATITGKQVSILKAGEEPARVDLLPAHRS